MPVDAMKTIVEQLICVHQSLYELALQKTEAIKQGDAQTVDRLSQKEKPLVAELESLEAKRTDQVARDVARPEATFSEWSQVVVSDSERPKWHELYLKLASSVLALKQANQLNQEMLRQSLQWVKMNINLLQPQTQSVNYGNRKNGWMDPSSGFSGRIDSRA